MSRFYDTMRNAYWRAKGLPVPPLVLDDHTSLISSVAFLPNSDQVVSGFRDGSVQTWRVEDGREMGKVMKQGSAAIPVTVSSDGHWIASGGEEKKVTIWDATTHEKVVELEGHDDWVRSLGFSRDSGRVVSGSYDGTIIVWRTRTGERLAVLNGHLGWVWSVCFSPNGDFVASIGNPGNASAKIRIWHSHSGEVYRVIPKADGYSLAWTPDRLIAGCWDGSIKYYDPSSGELLAKWTAHSHDVCLAVPPNGSFIASCSKRDSVARLWDTTTRQQIGPTLQHDQIQSVAISPAGTHLASVEDDNKLCIWSLEQIIPPSLLENIATISSDAPADVFNDSEQDQTEEGISEAYRGISVLEGRTLIEANVDVNGDFVNPSEIRQRIEQEAYTVLKDAPRRLFNVDNGMLCDKNAQILTIKSSDEYKELISSISTRTQLEQESERISSVVRKFFQFVMLSHRWQKYEITLRDIQGYTVTKLPHSGSASKLQNLCRTAAELGYRWAWSDTCCIDKDSTAELQESIISMFSWYRHGALTVVHLPDVTTPTGSRATLTGSEWHQRGWTLQEFLASKTILFYTRDWALYNNIQCANHKEVPSILDELESATGISREFISTFSPGTKDAREKLRWASGRITTEDEDIAYSLCGIFDLQLPIFYGEKKEKALGRLLEAIITRSGDVSVLQWTGKSSSYHSCLPHDISSFQSLPFTFTPSHESMDRLSVSELKENAPQALEHAIGLCDRLTGSESVAPLFTNARLTLASIVHPVRIKEIPSNQASHTYSIVSPGLHEIRIESMDRLLGANRAHRQTFVLARMRDNELLGVEDGEDETVELISWLTQPFFALLLVQKHRHREYTRVASECQITTQVVDVTKLLPVTIKTLEIL
ncbi:WD40 repeat-like protein [Paxillus ammoniavirescens]|nr:WD40 repeat-like protein [Paxillus ammoniavirescens]